MSIFSDISTFFEDLGSRLIGENEERRREDKEVEKTLENNLAVSLPASDTTVKILNVDLKPKENALNCNCHKYELVTRGKGTAIVRRGSNMLIEFEFNQDSKLKKIHQLTLFFNFGPQPLVNKGTRGVLEFTGKKLFDKEHDDWDHRVISQEGKKCVVEVQIPTDLPVGVWTLGAELKLRNDTSSLNRHLLRIDQLLYILFNPWSKHDDVYMKDEEGRQEYVLNDVGKIWVGAYPARERQWVFGQFDDAVLPACVLLMEKSGLNPEQRGDPVLVSRAISKMVNSNDDKGVLIGRWDGDYKDGVAPTAWTGSIKIMEEYIKGSSVKYGQCWVFSGVTTTVCRALGIPGRSVSNLNSAHDTNMSLTIDKYYDETGKEYKSATDVIPTGHGDSIWNYHVWNDVWMARKDLPPGFGGWQAIDATPQEASEGIYQCGPASLEAIRTGQTHLNYDVNFVLAEVNADIVYWQRDTTDKDGFKKLRADKIQIGRQILTKKPGLMAESFLAEDREDCTGDYKAPEGSKAERVTLLGAANRTRAARQAFRFPTMPEEDVAFKLEDVERVPVGQDFTIAVEMKNSAASVRRISIVLSATSEYYNGVKSSSIKRAEGVFELKPKEVETLRLKVTYNEYFDKLVEYGMIKLVALANVEETTQTWISEDTFQVLKPVMKIETEGTAEVEKPLPVKLSFDNPLDIALRNCILVVDGPGLTRPKVINIDDVPPKSEMKYEFNIFPKLTGSRSLVATFNSKELVDITGMTSIKIAADEEE